MVMSSVAAAGEGNGGVLRGGGIVCIGLLSGVKMAAELMATATCSRRFRLLRDKWPTKF